MTNKTVGGERPRAVEMLAKIWPDLTEVNKIKLTAMVETVAMMKDYGAATAPTKTTATA